MATRTIPCDSMPKIFFETNDHLSLTGWDRQEIEINIANEQDLVVHQNSDSISIEAVDDCSISIPVETTLMIGNVNGSASITNLRGDLSINNVGGHLTLRQVKGLTCENVGGHLRFNDIGGDLNLGNVGGSLKGERMAGKLNARNVGGSVKIVDLAVLDKIHVGGSVKVRLTSVPADLKVYAGGSIRLWLPEGTGYELEASSGGEKIVVTAKSGAHPLFDWPAADDCGGQWPAVAIDRRRQHHGGGFAWGRRPFG